MKVMRSIASSNRLSQSGFSLVELLTVVIIIVILVAMGLAMSQYDSFRDRVVAKGFANSVLAKCREAKNVSKAYGRDVSLLVDLDNEKVWLEVPRNDGSGKSDSYGTTLAAPSGRCDIKGFQEVNSATNTVTTGVCKIIFYNRGTSLSQSPLNASGGNDAIMHIGLKTDTYLSGALSDNFRSIMIMSNPGRAELFDVGCSATTQWSNSSWGWPLCRTL